MIELVVPDPSLIVLIAAAGAGKTTFAARHFEPGEILSSDAYRAAIAGDEADQRATRAAFRELHRALARRLAAGQLTVVDATNVERSARLALLARAAAAGRPAIAIVLDLPRPRSSPETPRAATGPWTRGSCGVTWRDSATRWTVWMRRSTERGSSGSSCFAIRAMWRRSRSSAGEPDAP